MLMKKCLIYLVKANITIKGANQSDNLGNELTSGDINNDGIADIIIGASDADPSGEVYVIYGANYANEKVFDLDLVKANITIKGVSGSGGVGQSIYSQDVNNDGIKDILMGGLDNINVIYGSANYANEKVFDLNVVSANISLISENDIDKLITVASGDINADGIKDIIGGQTIATGPSGLGRRVYVIYGSASYGTSKTFDLSSVSANITIKGEDLSDSLGDFVAVGDVTNDTIDDIIIGDILGDRPGSGGQGNAGKVYLFHGNERPPILQGNNTVNDTTPNQEVPLLCVTGFYEDADTDSLFRNYWKWYRNDILIEVIEGNTFTRQQLNLTDVTEAIGDLIRCSQKVSDGYLNSSWYNSTAAIIQAPITNIIERGRGGSTSFGRRTADIITPAPITLISEDVVNAPLIIKNNRNIPLRRIKITASSPTSDIVLTFDQDTIDLIPPGGEQIINLLLESFSTPGTYAITINISVDQPKFEDSTLLYIDLVERGIFNKTIIVNRITFSKDLFKENPECLELQELLDQAEIAINNNEFDKARELTEVAIRGCRDLVTSQVDIGLQQPSLINARIIYIISGFSALLIIILILLLTPNREKIKKLKFIRTKKKDKKEDNILINLKSYIKKELKQGYSKRKLKKLAIKKGWPRSIINKALK